MNSFYNCLIVEGSQEAIAKVLIDLRLSFPDLVEEEVAEAIRHRSWLQRELGAFRDSSPNRTTAGCTFQTEESLPSSLEQPPSHHVIWALIDSARSRGLTIGFLGIDTQRLPDSCVVARCSDAETGRFGTLGHNRFDYFRVMAHLLYEDNPSRFLTELTNGIAIGPVPYNHKPQWSDSNSPLRLNFKTEDPLRNDMSLSFGIDESGTFIIREGFLPAKGTSVSFHTRWSEAYALIHRASWSGVAADFDEDGQLMLSGYGVFKAGLIDERLDLAPFVADSSTEAVCDLDLTEEKARERFMLLYVQLLTDYLIYPFASPRSHKLAGDHLVNAQIWLAENGLDFTPIPNSFEVN